MKNLDKGVVIFGKKKSSSLLRPRFMTCYQSPGNYSMRKGLGRNEFAHNNKEKPGADLTSFSRS